MKIVCIISEHTEWLEYKRIADNKYMKRILVDSDKIAYGRYKDIKRHLKWWWKFHNDPKSFKKILRELDAEIVVTQKKV